MISCLWLDTLSDRARSVVRVWCLCRGRWLVVRPVRVVRVVIFVLVASRYNCTRRWSHPWGVPTPGDPAHQPALPGVCMNEAVGLLAQQVEVVVAVVRDERDDEAAVLRRARLHGVCTVGWSPW